VGQVRRVLGARAIQGSNSIEGYDVSVEDALAAIGGDEPSEASGDDWNAVSGYRRAMTYVLQLAQDEHFEYTPQILRIRAAMAHLNLVMTHPFRDGNGRMSRCLQTLVLARDQILAPQFSSIEEYLGRNTQAYYRVLQQVGGNTWHPQHDARPWIRSAWRLISSRRAASCAV
jgi:Fic family protein